MAEEQDNKYAEARKMEAYQRFERFNDALKASCEEAGIALNFTLSNSPIDTQQPNYQLQATANLLAFFLDLLSKLKCDPSKVESLVLEYKSSAEKWIGLIKKYAEDTKQPLDPLFYDLMLVADKELGGYFDNEAKELAVLNLGFIHNIAYKSSIRGMFDNLHLVSVKYLKSHLHANQAEILTKYPEIDAQQKQLHDKLVAYGTSVKDLTAESVEEALVNAQQITAKLTELSTDKAALTTAWQAIDDICRVPEKRNKADKEDATVKASCDKLFPENTKRLQKQTLIDKRWNALEADAAAFSQSAAKLLQTNLEQKLSAIPHVAALAKPVPPNANAPLKAQVEALAKLIENYRNHAGSMQTAKAQLEAYKIELQQDLAKYPSLAGTIKAQLAIVAERIECQEATMTAAANQVENIGELHQKAQENLNALGKVGELESDLAELEKQQTQATTDLAAYLAKAKKLFGDAQPDLAELRTQQESATKKLAAVSQTVKDSKNANGEVKAKLLVSQQQLKSLKKLNIPDVWFEESECDAIEQAMKWAEKPAYWTTLRAESKKGKLAKNYSKIRDARNLLMTDYKAKIAAQEELVKLRRQAVGRGFSALKLLNQEQDSLSTRAKLLDEKISVLDGIAKNQQLIAELPDKIAAKDDELTAAKAAETEQQAKEVERQELITALKEQLKALVSNAENLTKHVTFLTDSLDREIKANTLHEDISKEYCDDIKYINDIALPFSETYDKIIQTAEQNGALADIQDDVNYQIVTKSLNFSKTSATANNEKISAHRDSQVAAFAETKATIDLLLEGFNTYITQRSYFYQLLDILEMPMKFSANLAGMEYKTNYEVETKYIECAKQALDTFASKRDAASSQAAAKVLASSAVGFFSNVGSVITEDALKNIEEFAPTTSSAASAA